MKYAGVDSQTFILEVDPKSVRTVQILGESRRRPMAWEVIELYFEVTASI